MIIIVGCNKGGASKTTTAINLATLLVSDGADVCFVDADAQRSAARWHEDREAAGVKPAITLIERRGNITSTLISLAKKYDHVIVDVAGRNSQELITGAVAADILIAPHQCSQLDLDTIGELAVQVESVRNLNPDLAVYVYHSMASTNPVLKAQEREEFLTYLADYPTLQPLNAIGHYRKAYRDSIPLGQSVIEGPNAKAAAEVRELAQEVFGD